MIWQLRATVKLCCWAFIWFCHWITACTFYKCIYRPPVCTIKLACGAFLKCLPQVAYILLLCFSADTVSGCLPEEKSSNCSICLKDVFFFLHLKKVEVYKALIPIKEHLWHFPSEFYLGKAIKRDHLWFLMGGFNSFCKAIEYPIETLVINSPSFIIKSINICYSQPMFLWTQINQKGGTALRIFL